MKKFIYSLILIIFAFSFGVSQNRPDQINIIQTDANIYAGVFASSTVNSNYPVFAAVNGDTTGVGWGSGITPNGMGWNSSTSEIGSSSTYTVVFSRPYLLKEIIVYGLKNDFTENPTREPVDGETGVYANKTFVVQSSSNGVSDWLTVIGGSVTNNHLVINHFPFNEPPFSKGVRIVFDNSAPNSVDGMARLIEIKAFVKQ